MKKCFTRLVRDDPGATAIEYSLIAALISVVCIGAMTAAGTELNYTSISTHLQTALGGGGKG